MTTYNRQPARQRGGGGCGVSVYDPGARAFFFFADVISYPDLAHASHVPPDLAHASQVPDLAHVPDVPDLDHASHVPDLYHGYPDLVDARVFFIFSVLKIHLR